MKRWMIILICILVSLASVMGIVGARRGLLDFADDVIEDDKDNENDGDEDLAEPPELGTMTIKAQDIFYPSSGCVAIVTVYEDGEEKQQCFYLNDYYDEEDALAFTDIVIDNVVIGSCVVMYSKSVAFDFCNYCEGLTMLWNDSTKNSNCDCTLNFAVAKVTSSNSILYFSET